MGIIFKVIVNHRENAYSLWVAEREDPPGWQDAGLVRGTARECLDYIGARSLQALDGDRAEHVEAHHARCEVLQQEDSFRKRQSEAATEPSPARRHSQHAKVAWA